MVTGMLLEHGLAPWPNVADSGTDKQDEPGAFFFWSTELTCSSFLVVGSSWFGVVLSLWFSNTIFFGMAFGFNTVSLRRTWKQFKSHHFVRYGLPLLVSMPPTDPSHGLLQHWWQHFVVSDFVRRWSICRNWVHLHSIWSTWREDFVGEEPLKKK